MNVFFDPRKDESNRQKHRISLGRTRDFDFSAALFDVDDSQDYGEVRYNAIGWLDASLYTLTFLWQDDAPRAISLRRSSRQEQKRYAEEF